MQKKWFYEQTQQRFNAPAEHVTPALCPFRVQCVSLTMRWWHVSAMGAHPPHQVNWTAAQHQHSYTHLPP